MDTDKLCRRWQKRFRGLLRDLRVLFDDTLATGEVEAIHNLRVALRRSRLLVLVGRPVLGREPMNQFRHWAFQVMEMLGTVRDCDVTLEWLAHNGGNGAVAAALRKHRQRLWHRLRPSLAAMAVFDAKPFGRLDADARAKKLRRRFDAIAARFHARVMADRRRFHAMDTEALHEFRRNIRRWRYLQEVLLSRRQQKSNKPLLRLIALQEALGEMQNCEVIRLFLRTHRLPRAARALDGLLAQQQGKWFRKAARRLETVL